MKIGKVNEPFSSNVYDLLLDEVRSFIRNEFKKIIYTDDDLKQAHRDNLLYSIDFIYKHYNIERNCPVVIESTDGYYDYILAIALAFYPPYKIDSFLDYQAKLYRKRKGKDFLNVLEFTATGIMEMNSNDFDNSLRLEKVMNWVKQNRSKSNVPVKRILKKGELKLLWGGAPQTLRELSERLCEMEFTNKVNDFERAFAGKRIIWKKEPEFLAFLMYYLYHLRPPLLKASTGKAYLKAASTCFYDSSRKPVSQTFLSDAAYNITKRRSERYTVLRKRVKSLISEIQSLNKS